MASCLVHFYIAKQIAQISSRKRSQAKSDSISEFYLSTSTELDLIDLYSCSTSHSEEDMFAVSNFFGMKKSGTFIELGALDGLTSSNTHLFEKCLNWTGILIEPGKENFEKLKINRPNQVLLNVAICDGIRNVDFVEGIASGGIVEFMPPSFIQEWHSYLLNKTMFMRNMVINNQNCSLWGPFEATFSEGCATDCAPFHAFDSAAAACLSMAECAAITSVPSENGLHYELRAGHKLSKSMSGEISYVMGPCSQMCIPLDMAISASNFHSEVNHFDFLSIDVEGAELEVIKSIGSRNTTFSVIVIETDVDTPEKNHRVRSFLDARDYVYYGGDGFNNDWFYHKTFSPSKSNFPKNPFEPWASIHPITGCSENSATTNMSFLSPGYVFFQSFYYVRSEFTFWQDSTHGARFDLSQWALISKEAVKQRFYYDSALRPLRVRVFDGQDQLCNALAGFKERLEVEGAILITDFIPAMMTHYYHLLEHLLGIWTTKSHFSPAEEPRCIVFPQVERAGLSQVGKDLLGAVFPGAPIVFMHQIQMISRRYAIHFRWAVASDRSATDHGSVNQMATGILRHLKLRSSALVSRVAASMQMPARVERAPLTLTYVSRRESGNRRLEEGVERQLLSEIRQDCSEVAVHDVLFSGMSLAQQVGVARSSHLMLGVHGNGLSNALWMLSPGALLELFPQGARILAYQQFAEARGLWYAGFVGPGGAEFPDGSCGDSPEAYARLCGWVLKQTGEINTIMREVPREAVVRRVRELARRVGSALAANGVGAATGSR